MINFAREVILREQVREGKGSRGNKGADPLLNHPLRWSSEGRRGSSSSFLTAPYLPLTPLTLLLWKLKIFLNQKFR
ncbi:MAG: hypothetical protein A3F95_01015 [Candidatus Nealsonbacteria bacterium RIFCSPLOWO2_12_FULL_39_31]|uniref:Uncharacterized protein n=2 Tax=Candidatus Nealsoniibacteriota TaxID=1817911 RepID=A0A1G2EJT3_9BACT|nr:MAG: hypothetical protein A2626_02515 [Candidatus Nealsonbacteria bacterium RIFCSPHIGHO2_01_FULL_38_55]OGZ22782.1 MAG: hypothetical protein A3E18_01885 [Candidatus Nealsonbacteria bacterium RIFCSPHIGHO2_12_FULL_38_18]OGZ23698.1 MAG: hypothetical protein A2981_00515 [Candidatus Nealsonbacteria bacterium RIFCSPLOWO2_01_FULL_38_120]OGZ26055.1 MAG: hypothetical protein A3F95_01015 [Candidatus Nealsonbacteria bacterium RIFCSPLOWO2_12_FULL_39_31]